MCTLVETNDVRILLDAGVSLGPNRFGLPPHPREYAALRQCRRRIIEAAEKADVITVSHYHFDHHTPSFTDWANLWSSAEISARIYGGKIVFAKNFKSKINFSQRKRGWLFKKRIEELSVRLEYADGRTFKFGGTTIKFPPPVFHGRENSELGWVLMTIIEHEGEKVIFAPDIQGPLCDSTLRLMLNEMADLAIIGGPPIYLADFRVSREMISKAVRNIALLSRRIPIIILDHHILRDKNWRDWLQKVIDDSIKIGHSIFTAAEYIGRENHLLEANRKGLFEAEPPSREFMQWTKIPMRKRKLIMPPI